MAMNINVTREDLLKGLNNLLSVTSKKGTIAILSNVLIKAENNSIEITGTDLEVGIRNKVPAEILEAGTLTLPCKKLFEIIRETQADTVNLEEKENNWVNIKAANSDYNLAGMPSEEFPSFPEYSEEKLISFSPEILSDIIDKTSYAVAQEGESQFNLSGVLLEKEEREGKVYMKMVASDGHRLAYMEREVEDDISGLNFERTILIPKKGLQEIRKLCDSSGEIFIGFDEKQNILKSNDSIMIIRLMNGDFPDYKNIINIINKDSFIEVERNVFLTSMKRMNIFTEDRFNVVQLKIDKNNMVLTSQNADIGNAKDEIAIKYSGEPFNLYFNGKYFVDALNVLESKKVRLYISSEKSPCLIKTDEDPGFLSVIMPMKI